jgi:hypothetical protein
MTGTWGIMITRHACTIDYGCFEKEEKFEWLIK